MADLIKPDRAPAESPQTQREWARRQVEKKRKLYADLVGYVLINGFLVAIWAMTGFGYFWPAWVLAGWGVLWLLSAWNIYRARPVTEEDIDRELFRRS